jgi:hypothetical protein
MAILSPYEQIELLPLVKAYPNLSRRYREVSCVAGLKLAGVERPEWLRLYPIPFRDLDSNRQFRKYEPISVGVARHGGDRRPESRRADADTIEPAGKPLGTENGWRARRPIVEPMIEGSMCGIQDARRTSGQSLGMFRPAEVKDILIDRVEPDPVKSRDAEAWAAQGTLLGDPNREQERKALEQIPYRFHYSYRCSASDCSGHKQSIVDWELARFYLRVRNLEDWRERVRQKWIGELCAADRDTAFIVGNQHQHLDGFLVLGVWYPPKEPEQLGLAQLGDL